MLRRATAGLGLTVRCSSDCLAVGLVFVGIATIACLAPVQSDTWWLLRSGRDIWSHGVISLADTYSHTATGRYWPNHEWLAGVLFYGTYYLGGFPVLTASCAAAIVGAWWLSWKLAGGAFENRFLFFSISTVSAAGVWAIRPQVFTLFLFSLVCTLLVARRYWWLPLVFLVWANLHGAVALGFVAIAATGLARVIDERRIPWKLAVVSAFSFVATCLTPLGFGLWTFIPESMAKSRVNQLIEWQGPAWDPGHLPFWLLAGVLVFAAFRWRNRLRGTTLDLVVIALAVLPLAVMARRNVAIFVLIGAPALATLFSSRNDEKARRMAGERHRVNAGILASALTAALVVVFLFWRPPAPRLGWDPIATEAIDAIKRCDGPLYNTYDGGGILIWFLPEKAVFIDNRQDPYPVEFLQAARVLESSGDYESLFEKHEISCAAIPSDSWTAARLSVAPAWTRSYQDARWAVFSKSVR